MALGKAKLVPKTETLTNARSSNTSTPSRASASLNTAPKTWSTAHLAHKMPTLAPGRAPTLAPFHRALPLAHAATLRGAPSRAPGNPYSLAQGMQKMHLGAPGVPFAPSIAPAPTMLPNANAAFTATQAPSNAPFAFQNTHRHRAHGWFQNDVCIKSPWKHGTFRRGDVISLPFSKPNLDPHSSQNVTRTPFVHVFTKRRMFIVLWISLEHLFCLPLYSWQGTGIDQMLKFNPELKYDYVCLVNFRDREMWKQKGHYQALEFVHGHAEGRLTEHTTCHIVGGHTVDWREDIAWVGRITEGSWERLSEAYVGRGEFYRGVEDEWTESEGGAEEGRDPRLISMSKHPGLRREYQRSRPV